MKNKNWFELSIDEVTSILKTDINKGLTDIEAEQRLKQYGKNELLIKTRSPITRFLLQFHNLLLYVLMVAAFVAVLLDKTLDMWVI